MRKINSLVLALVLSVLVLVNQAQAAITLPTTLDVSDVETAAGLMIAALALIWVAHKVKGFFGR